jgi:N6-L-threonylcarbamoyladenine synthase
MPGLEYSFSGLKTAVRVFLQKHSTGFIEQHLADICASIQYTIVKTLLLKLKKAATETQIRHIALAGGVAANNGLRMGLETLAAEQKWATYIPALAFCTDNAAMVGMAAHFALGAGRLGQMNENVFVSGESAPAGLAFMQT